MTNGFAQDQVVFDQLRLLSKQSKQETNLDCLLFSRAQATTDLVSCPVTTLEAYERDFFRKLSPDFMQLLADKSKDLTKDVCGS